MRHIAVMQGRLVPPEGGHFQSFPRKRWRDEFGYARSAGLDAIEWIYDVYGEGSNPLESDAGVDEMISLSQKNEIAVRSLCVDYFMEHPFLRSSIEKERRLVEKMEWLLERCRVAGISRIVIPFVDNSRIENEHEMEKVVKIVKELLPLAEANHVELHLETAQPPGPFARLLEQCQSPIVCVNYDSGNSASLGYRVEEEFSAYGTRIGSVHIKDRKRGSSTVPLGTGDADLGAVFLGLAKLSYPGDYVLQIARSVAGDELNWIAKNRAWVAGQIEAAAGSAA